MNNLFISYLMFASVMFILSAFSTAQVAPSAEEIRPLLPGMEIPDVSLTSLEEAEVPLKELATEGPLALVFFRGGW